MNRYPLLSSLVLLIALTSCVVGELRLVWSDEFDYEGLADPAKWTYDVGGSGWGNNELQYYTTNRLENARVGNGVLTIEAIRESYVRAREYTSARLLSTGEGSWQYGRFEIRAKLPRGRGTWPAIWMLPVDWVYGGWPESGEIDIMEHVGYDMQRVHATVHTERFNHLRGTQVGDSIVLEDVDTRFHVYSMEWRPDRIDAFVDGQPYFTFHNDGSGSASWPFDQRFRLLLNIAIGGNWGGVEGVDDSIFPQRMEIDYVRVYAFEEEEPTWAGHPIIGSAYVDSGDFLGWLALGNSDWVYSLALEKWLFLPESFVGAGGAWVYAAD